MPSRQQLKQLQLALINAFPSKSSLERLLYFELEKNLNEITRDSDLQDIVFNIIQTAEAQGWLLDLVRAARRENPGNSALGVIALELSPTKGNGELLTGNSAGFEQGFDPDQNVAPLVAGVFDSQGVSEILTKNEEHFVAHFSPFPVKSFLLDETPPTPDLNIPQEPNNQEQQKILLIAALPQDLHLDKEIREVEEAIKQSVKQNSFEVKIRTAVRPIDIDRALTEERPQIVHFCGHGMEDGSLVLEDDDSNQIPVLPGGLAALFKLHTDYVKCVLLNACYSALPAEAISQHINYVIGMNQPIEDRAGIVFTQGFYGGLGYRNSGNQDLFQIAFDEAMVVIQMGNISQDNIPILKRKQVSEKSDKPVPEIILQKKQNKFYFPVAITLVLTFLVLGTYGHIQSIQTRLPLNRKIDYTRLQKLSG